MTTPAVEIGDVGVRVFAVYPPGHVKAGQIITRQRPCPGKPGEPCQQVLDQTGLNREWLAKIGKLGDGWRAASEIDKHGSAWYPRACAKHMREP